MQERLLFCVFVLFFTTISFSETAASEGSDKTAFLSQRSESGSTVSVVCPSIPRSSVPHSVSHFLDSDSPASHFSAPHWKLLNIDKRTAVIKHCFDKKEAPSGKNEENGKSSEQLAMIFAKKTDLFFGKEIDFPYLIEELSPSVWVKSNRPGLVLGAQIVLPNAMNPNTGRPITFLVTGAKYRNIGQWEKLDFNDSQNRPALYRSTVQTAKNLRAELEYKLDFSNMYVRQLVLYVEGTPISENRPSEQTLWINETELSGIAPIWSILGKKSREFERLEPEYAAFLYEMEQCEQKEQQPQPAANGNSDKNDSDSAISAPLSNNASTETSSGNLVFQEEKVKAASPILHVHRIELIGAASPAKLMQKTASRSVEEVKRRGFRLKFDPINTSGFLALAVSEPVFQEHTTEFASGKIYWDRSINYGRDLSDPYNIDLKKGLKKDDDFLRMDPTVAARSELERYQTVRYQEMQLHEPGTQSVSETVYYSGSTTDPAVGFTQAPSPYSSQSVLPIQTVKLLGQTIRLRDPVEKTEQSLGIRAIEYRGEPLEFLGKMRFNAIWLSTPPSRELLEEAIQERFWLICPPPPEIGMEGAAPQGGYDRIIPTPLEYQNVLCWNLGEYMIKANAADTEKRARRLKAADRAARQDRPFIGSVDSGARDYSRIQDMIILNRREPLLSTLQLSEYGNWLRNYGRSTIPGTPRWAAIQTQPDANLVAQWDLFGGHREQPVIISFDQIRLMVRQALASGIHGILFTSQTPLTDQNPETEYRVKALALMNLELMLIEEWFADGIVQEFVESNDPRLSGVVLHINNAKLLLPLWNERDTQYAMGQAFKQEAVFRLGVVHETYDKKLLVPGGFEKVDTERVAGGTLIRIGDASMNSIIFMSENEKFSGLIGNRAKVFGQAMAQLALDLAKMRLESDEKTFLLLKQAEESKMIPIWEYDYNPLVKMDEQETLLKSTRDYIQMSETRYKNEDYIPAYLQAERATRGLRDAQRRIWKYATRADENDSMTPVSTCFHTIPFYITMFNSFRGAELGPNQLLYGDFECTFVNWGAAGWRHDQHQGEKDVISYAYLRTDDLQAGVPNKFLELEVEPAKQLGRTVQIETAPIWISTPSIPLNTGQLVCVSGRFNIPQRITGSVDGLIIWDSIGGDALALREWDTNGNWKKFVFYRYVPANGLFETRFYLSGVGKVWIDDVEIRPVLFNMMPEPSVEPQPQSAPSRWERWNPWQYLPGRQQQQENRQP